jgi:hypothetical protein
MNDIRQKAIKLLGQGIPAINVASALGCDPSYISQLMSQEDFAAAVQDLRLKALSDATERDSRLNGIEDKLISRIDDDISNNPLAFRSAMDRVRALSMVNAMKRRGAAGDMHAGSGHTTIINLTLPTHLIDKYANRRVEMDINNQVVSVGTQNLITMQAGTLNNLLEENKHEYDTAKYM